MNCCPFFCKFVRQQLQKMHIELILHKDDLNEIFRKHKIERAYVFGSVLRDDFKDRSDIDFLIRFKEGLDPLEQGELWWDLHDTLRELFNRDVDLVTERSLKNPFFIQEIEETKRLVYG